MTKLPLRQDVYKRREGCPAYLTVYLSIVLAILLSLCLALIEGVRSNAIRLETECVMDIGLNSIMAEYHRELFRQYNLLAIDSSYGMPYAGKGNTEYHLLKYMQRNFSQEDVFLSDFFYKDFLALEVEDVEITRFSIFTDGGGRVFRRRAAEAVRDDVGLELLERLLEWMEMIENNGLCERDIASEKREVDEAIMEYDGMEIQISEEEWMTVEVDNPTDYLEQIRSAGILEHVVENPSLLSRRSFDVELYVSHRMRQGQSSVGNMAISDMSTREQRVEDFLFREYLLRYMGRYGLEKDNSRLLYQMEYILGGENNDIENLRKMVNSICAIREVANTIYLFSDETKCAEADILANILAAAMLLPEIAPLLKTTLLLGWAYAESLYDVEMLLMGKSVPLLKDNTTWHYGLRGALQTQNSGAYNGALIGLTYEDYLRIFMMLEDVDTLAVRAMDMIEADMRITPGNERFRMDACYDSVEARAIVKSAYGYEVDITREKSYQ